jgi:hypothetical protein
MIASVSTMKNSLIEPRRQLQRIGTKELELTTTTNNIKHMIILLLTTATALLQPNIIEKINSVADCVVVCGATELKESQPHIVKSFALWTETVEDVHLEVVKQNTDFLFHIPRKLNPANTMQAVRSREYG